MKKIYSIIFAAAALFAASSCQEEIVEPDLGTQENESMTITAGFGAETKTVLDGLKTYWTEGDQISVFDSNKKESDTDDGNNRCFSIDETATNFEDGKAAFATFKYDGEFVWPQNDQPDPLVVALHPYQENAYCDFFYYDRNYITGLNIPAEQVALEGGFDANATFALATSKYSESDNLTFTNLYSLLRITINEDDVKEVKVSVEGGKIVGEAKVQLNLEMEDENTPVFNGGTLSATENGTNTVTLTCKDGFVAGEDYYIAIAPVTYTNIKVYLDDVLVKDTTPEGGKTLEANTVYNISNLDDPHTVADGVYLNDEGVYEISKEAGLFWLAEQVKEGNTFDGKTVKLVADITMTKDWTPIGNMKDGVTKSFRGNFDGKKSETENYTISNLKATAQEGVGFFGFKWDGDVTNVNFDSAEISGNHYAGVIVGWADGANYNNNFSINNCKVTNSTVTLAAELVGEEYDNGDKAGGIVGYAYAIHVTDNTVSSTTITGYRDLGGIAGCAINNTSADDYAVVTGNTIGENVKVVVDNTQNYKSYTSVDQHNVSSYVGRIDNKVGGHDNEIKDNTGDAVLETPKYPVARDLIFSETSVTLTLGDTFTAPTLSGETSGVTYASSNEEVATVNSETGAVTILGAGETTITASAPATDDYLAGSATYTLTVNKAARTLTFSSATATATVGKSFTPPILTGTPDISGVKYTSSNTDVATVDENTGAVELKTEGKVVITATIDGNEQYIGAEAKYELDIEVIKLYVENDSDYSSLYLYLYDASGNNGWPGKQLTEKEIVNGVEYFIYKPAAEELDKQYTYIFNNNDKNAKVEEYKTITFDTDKYIWLTKKYTKEITSENTGNSDPLTLYIKNEKNWSKLNYYMWFGSDDSIKNAAWPGSAVDMSKKTIIENNTYFYIEISDSKWEWDKVIINDGSNQTNDLSVSSMTDDIYVTNNGYIWKGADQTL